MSLLRVALLIETSREYARGLLRGVADYYRDHGPWSIYFQPHGLDSPPPPWLESWKGDGILARVDDRRMADAILATGIPAVDLRGAYSDLGIPFIGVDNFRVAEVAFEHLKSCGLRNFAFCGTPRGENRNQDWRCDVFVDLVEKSGRKCSVYLNEQPHQPDNWERQQALIVEWLHSLPKPVGIMACNDDLGHRVLDACRRGGLSVPDAIAVVGVDNDTYLCNLCTPPLSSVDINSDHVGYEAAKLLDALMHGMQSNPEPLLLGPPRGVAARMSTDTLHVDSPEIATAIRYIRKHAIDGISVKDVLKNTSCSLSTLERGVKKKLGCTVSGEITRTKLSHAKMLLSETQQPVNVISQRSGFREAKYFCEVFRKHEGMTASAYRKQFRDQSPTHPKARAPLS